MLKPIRICILAAGLALGSGLVWAQSSTFSNSAVTPVATQSAPAQTGRSTVAPGNAPVENTDDEEENSQFKYSGAVRALAAKTGLSKQAVYWIFLIINFLILLAGLAWVVKKVLPHGFAPRTAEIQRGIEEARKASAEASARLAEIESRLARLDSQVAEIRSAAEADFSVEEQRIKAAAEQDASNVVASAEQEIEAAVRNAQRDLKSFVADLAVNLAEKKIAVDDSTDKALIRGFAAQLGKDGR